MEKLKPSYPAGEIVKWYSCIGKVWQVLKKLTIDLTYNSRTPLLDIHPREVNTGSHKVYA